MGEGMFIGGITGGEGEPKGEGMGIINTGGSMGSGSLVSSMGGGMGCMGICDG